MRISAGLLLVAGQALGQAATPSNSPLSFEVASIKPSGPFDPVAFGSGKAHFGMSVDKAKLESISATRV